MTFQDLRYVKIDGVNPLYLIVGKINRYFDEYNRNKYFTLVLTDESKEIMKKYEELWGKIRDIIRSVTNNSDSYIEKYMKINFNSVDDLPSKKTL